MLSTVANIKTHLCSSRNRPQIIRMPLFSCSPLLLPFPADKSWICDTEEGPGPRTEGNPTSFHFLPKSWGNNSSTAKEFTLPFCTVHNLQRYLHRKFALATVVNYNKQNEAHHPFGYRTLYGRIPSIRSNKGKDEYIPLFWLLTGDDWPSAPDGMFTLWCLYWNMSPVATRGQHFHVIYKTVLLKNTIKVQEYVILTNKSE